MFQFLHHLRDAERLQPYDSVYGVFEEEGDLPVYPGAGFKRKTHVQIAVVNPACIAGYFRVPDLA